MLSVSMPAATNVYQAKGESLLQNVINTDAGCIERLSGEGQQFTAESDDTNQMHAVAAPSITGIQLA
jgi:hypothetical protein